MLQLLIISAVYTQMTAKHQWRTYENLINNMTEFYTIIQITLFEIQPSLTNTQLEKLFS